ncbi:hypothetical protein ACFX2K_007462 [Malus domestica]
MGTSVQVTPLCGVYNENPLSCLVPIDDFNFLIDCGWNDHFDPSLLQPFSRVALTVDAVLLSHPDTLHLGALPYSMKQLGLSASVFSCERNTVRSTKISLHFDISCRQDETIRKALLESDILQSAPDEFRALPASYAGKSTGSGISTDGTNGSGHRPGLGNIPESCVACMFTTPPEIYNHPRTQSNYSLWSGSVHPSSSTPPTL